MKNTNWRELARKLIRAESTITAYDQDPITEKEAEFLSEHIGWIVAEYLEGKFTRAELKNVRNTARSNRSIRGNDKNHPGYS
jgi:hypothetical protein